MAKKPLTASFGSVSTGSLLNTDLIPAFADELETLRNGTNRAHAKLVRDARKLELDEDGYYADKDASDHIISELFDALSTYAPDHGYFGSLEGDGADFGFWVDQEFLRQPDMFDCVRISDPSELDELNAEYPMVNEALYVNDHGNATLYAAWTRGKKTTWRVVWDIV